MRKFAKVCFLVFLVFFLGGCWEKEQAVEPVVGEEEFQGEEGEMPAALAAEEESRKQAQNQPGGSAEKVKADVADAVERMQNVCMARDPIDRAPCYREHEQAYFKHINSYAIDVLSRQSDFDEAWFETFRQMIASTEYNIGKICLQNNGGSPAKRAECNMLQYYFLSNWGDLLEDDAWKHTELAQVGFRIVEARKQREEEKKRALTDPEAMVRFICSKPPKERSAGEQAVCDANNL